MKWVALIGDIAEDVLEKAGKAVLAKGLLVPKTWSDIPGTSQEKKQLESREQPIRIMGSLRTHGMASYLTWGGQRRMAGIPVPPLSRPPLCLLPSGTEERAMEWHPVMHVSAIIAPASPCTWLHPVTFGSFSLRLLCLFKHSLRSCYNGTLQMAVQPGYPKIGHLGLRG